jgi:hypothetical protein
MRPTRDRCDSHHMDVVAVILAIAVFAILLVAIEAIDRV